MTLCETQALYARCLLGESDFRNPLVGSIALRPHQQSAVTRAAASLEEFGGALLSDHVGTGKTYVALALAAASGKAIVVAPAVLREMWTDAAKRAAVQLTFVSTESLSRAACTIGDCEATGPTRLIIVDEAHYFRNTATRRFSALAQLCSDAHVLLVSATPIHNRRRDLHSLLSLFLGSRGSNLTASEIGRVVIRRNRDNVDAGASMPRIEPPRWCELTHDEEIPALLLALPPPLSPRDGGDGGALVVHSLIRQWVSSDAALYRALVRRLQKATALIAVLESGSYPSAPELSSWIAGEDCVQLGFGELLAPQNSDAPVLLPIVRRHLSAIRSLARRMRESNQRDIERAQTIRTIRATHSGVPIVAFSQYTDTVDALFGLLAPDGSTAVLTGRGARVFGGHISRIEAIARFAPRASGVPPPRTAEAVTLLLTTDLLSEGVNLQDAGVVIHLDLPWTPARMEQRLGRVARMGSPHESVFSYIMRPPASADCLIRAEGILRQKMHSAGVVTDGLHAILPDGNTSLPGAASVPAVMEELRSVLESWSARACQSTLPHFASATVMSPINGFLALYCCAGQYRILACDASGVTDDPARALATMRFGGYEEVSGDPGELKQALDVAYRQLRAARALGSLESMISPRHSVRRNAFRRIVQIAGRSRPHARAQVAALSARARQAILGRLSAIQENRLAVLSSRVLLDEDWLTEVGKLSSNAPLEPAAEIIAMIIYRKSAL